ncbi:MAG: leucyl aminopeptidase [Rickettsiales bacterium]
MKLSFSPLTSLNNTGKSGKPQAIAILVSDALSLSGLAADIDKRSGGLIKRGINGKFKGKKGEILSIVAPASIGVERVLVAGTGSEKESKPASFEDVGGEILAAANAAGVAGVTVIIDKIPGKIKVSEAAARIGFGAMLKSYRFDKYRTTEKPEEKPSVVSFTVASADEKAAKKAYQPLAALQEAIFFTRDIVSEPPNILHPESYAQLCKGLTRHGLKVEVLGEKEMKALGMGSLLGVGQGSVRESKLVVMQWNGADKKMKPLAFVGKGVCFDSGGISIKPATGMDEMKWDMGGSATVVGLMMTLALRKAKVNAVGVIGLVENMPDGNAQRPGDVVTSMSGQTIEVLNTDAEGRLVLADALWYTQDRFKPQFMIDLATLTGAVIIALGSSRAGMFSNNDQLAERLFKLGEETGEEVWRLPLGDVYDKQINSEIADMQNIGADREAGSTMGAVFLQRFVNKLPWVHLDIAGVAWSKKPASTRPKGATAWGVKLLNAFVQKHYEK